MRIFDESTKEYCEKHAFVEALSNCLRKANKSLEGCSYELFAKDAPNGLVFQEYLVLRFNGGAISCRNANINSNMANLREISNLVDGGYYEEVDNYRRTSEEWGRCTFNEDGSLEISVAPKKQGARARVISNLHLEWHGEANSPLWFIVEYEDGSKETICELEPSETPSWVNGADAGPESLSENPDYEEWYNEALEEAHSQGFVLEAELR